MSEVSQTRPSYKVNHARVVPMLDIRATGRNAVALPYSYLEMVQYNPSVALVLMFATARFALRATAFLPFMKTWLKTRSSPSRKMTQRTNSPIRTSPSFDALKSSR
jgi:hypothetical protein